MKNRHFKRVIFALTLALSATNCGITKLPLMTPVYAATNSDTAYISATASSGMPIYCYPSKNIDWSMVSSTGLYPLKKYWQKPTAAEFVTKARSVDSSLRRVDWDPETQDPVELANSLSGNVILVIKEGTTNISNIGNIGGNVNGGPCVKYIYIPESVTTVGSFSTFDSVKEIILSSKTTSYNGSAFTGMDSLQCLVLPPSSSSYSMEFDNDVCLKSLVNPGTWGTKGIRARDCTNLTYISDPEGTTYVGDYALYGTKATSYKVPSTATAIGWNAFSNCKVIPTSFPEGLTTLNGYAFYGNTAITKMVLPSTCTSIGFSCFAGCSNLTELAYKAKTPITFGNAFVPTVPTGSGHIIYGYTDSDANESLEMAATLYGWTLKHASNCSDASFNPPYYVSHTINLNESNTEATLTVNYSDAITDSADLLYSFNGGEYTSSNSFTVNKNCNVKVTCKDTDGNVSTVKTFTVSGIVDSEKPTISNVTAVSEDNLRTKVTVTATDNMDEASSLTVSIDGTNYNYNVGTPFYINKNGTYNITCKDLAGNVSDSYPLTIDYLVDKEAPVITSVSYEMDIPNKRVVVNPTATDNWTPAENLQYSVDGGTTWEVGKTYITADGRYELLAKDEAGNISNPYSFTSTKIADTFSSGTAPSVSSIQKKTFDGKSSIIFDTISLGSGSKAATGIDEVYIGTGLDKTKLNSSDWSYDSMFNELVIKKTYLNGLSNDDYPISIKFNDFFGTEAALGKIMVDKDSSLPTDTKAPVISSTSVSELNESKTQCSITVIASDETSSNLKYSIDGVNWSTSNVIPVTKNGTYNVYVKDEAGNISNAYPTVVDKFEGSNSGSSSGSGSVPSIQFISSDTFDKSNPKDIFIDGIKLGEGDKAATNVTDVRIDSIGSIPSLYWTYDKKFGEIKINKDFLNTLDASSNPYKIYASFNDAASTEIPVSRLTVTGSSPTALSGTKPDVVTSNVEYDGSDVKFELKYGTDDYACDGLNAVTVNGSRISKSYYQVVDDILTISHNYIDCLPQSAYTVGVEFNDKSSTQVADKLSFTIPKQAEDTGWVNEDTSTLNILWNRNSTYDLNIPLNSHRNVISVTADNVSLESYVFNTSTGILTIPAPAMNALSLGTHSFVVKFAPMDVSQTSMARVSALNSLRLLDSTATFTSRARDLKASDLMPLSAESFGINPRLGIVANVVEYGTSGLTYEKGPNGETVITGVTDNSNTPGVIEIPDNINGTPIQIQPGSLPTGTPIAGGDTAKNYVEQTGGQYVKPDGTIEDYKNPSQGGNGGTGGTGTGNGGTNINIGFGGQGGSGTITTTGGAINIIIPPQQTTGSSIGTNNNSNNNNTYDYLNSINQSKQREIDDLRKDIEEYRKQLEETKLSISRKLNENIPYILPIGKLDGIEGEVQKGINEVKVNKTIKGMVLGVDFEGHEVSFEDIPRTHWAYQPIITCTRHALLPDADDKLFAPKAEVTKATALKAIIRTLSFKNVKVNYNRDKVEEIYKNSKLTFDKDKDEEYYYATYLISVYGERIVPVLKDLDSNDILTRESITNMCYDIFNGELGTLPTVVKFKDINVFTDEYANVKFIVEAGLLRGDSQGNFNPTQPLNRAEFAVLLSNLYFKF